MHILTVHIYIQQFVHGFRMLALEDYIAIWNIWTYSNIVFPVGRSQVIFALSKASGLGFHSRSGHPRFDCVPRVIFLFPHSSIGTTGSTDRFYWGLRYYQKEVRTSPERTALRKKNCEAHQKLQLLQPTLFQIHPDILFFWTNGLMVFCKHLPSARFLRLVSSKCFSP